MTAEQYQELEKKFPMRADLDATATAIQLGQQMVLRAVREGFTPT